MLFAYLIATIILTACSSTLGRLATKSTSKPVRRTGVHLLITVLAPMAIAVGLGAILSIELSLAAFTALGVLLFSLVLQIGD